VAECFCLLAQPRAGVVGVMWFVHCQGEGGISSLNMNGDSRMPVLDNALLLRVLAVTPLSVSTAPPACLRRCVPPAAGHFGLGCCCSAPASAAFATLRPSGGTGELSMIQSDGGLCRLRLGPTPAPAASNGDRAPPSRSRRNCRRPRSAAARPLRGRLPSAPALSSASATRPHDGIGGPAR